jgi:MFS family permease
MTAVPVSVPSKRDERRAAAVAFGAHALHDGYTDLIYVMLPLWQAEFGLGYAALGLLKTVFSGTLAAFQVPSTLIAERFGLPIVLAIGTALAGFGYCIAGASVGVPILVFALLVSGLGASTQHPLASALIARAFTGARSRTALGTYNFAGDIGKMTVPALASLLLLAMPWRQAVMLLGSAGLLAAVALFIFAPRLAPVPPTPKRVSENAGRGAGHFGFSLLLAVGVIDSATRMAFLTFLPFVLTAKGASVPAIGFALTLVFAGGAAGKLVFGFIGARLGTVAAVWLTEIMTAAGIVALLPLPLYGAMALLPLIGVALNGTSSVLYGSVPDLVEPSRHSRAFGIFYTGTIGGGAISPPLYGMLGDAIGVSHVLLVVACVVLLTLPLTLALRPALIAARAT